MTYSYARATSGHVRRREAEKVATRTTSHNCGPNPGATLRRWSTRARAFRLAAEPVDFSVAWRRLRLVPTYQIGSAICGGGISVGDGIFYPRTRRRRERNDTATAVAHTHTQPAAISLVHTPAAFSLVTTLLARRTSTTIAVPEFVR